MKMHRRHYLSFLILVLFVTAIGLKAQAKSNRGELTGVVNINEASLAQLTLLPGVGPKKAEAIQTYAKAQPFKTVDDLKRVKGFGDKALAKLRPYITVSGPTTAKMVQKSPQQASR